MLGQWFTPINKELSMMLIKQVVHVIGEVRQGSCGKVAKIGVPGLNFYQSPKTADHEIIFKQKRHK